MLAYRDNKVNSPVTVVDNGVEKDAGESPETREIGGRMQRARERSGLTAREVARRMGRSYVSISRWENGKQRISDEDLRSFAQVVGSTFLLLRHGEEGLGDRERELVAEAEARGHKRAIEELRERLLRILDEAAELKQQPLYDDPALLRRPADEVLEEKKRAAEDSRSRSTRRGKGA